MIAMRDIDDPHVLPFLKYTHVGRWRKVQSKHPARHSGDCSNQLVVGGVIEDLQRQDPRQRFHKNDASTKTVEGKQHGNTAGWKTETVLLCNGIIFRGTTNLGKKVTRTRDMTLDFHNQRIPFSSHLVAELRPPMTVSTLRHQLLSPLLRSPRYLLPRYIALCLRRC